METAAQLRRPLDVLATGRDYSIVADLPKNTTGLAVQAEEAGADAILMNIDGEEGGRAGHFGSYELHDTYINDVISTVSVPCGILIGGARLMTEEYWERVMSSQFGFVEMLAHQMPLFMLNDSRLKKVVAITTGYILEQVRQISQTEGVEAIDAATVAPQARGTPFSVLDYATLAVVVGLSSKPVLLRTQKKLTREDLVKVMAVGVKGLVVDPCVLSGAEEAYKEELMQFRPPAPASAP